MVSAPNVLIVEDDPVFRRVIAFTLTKSGMTTETASDGQFAIDRLLQGGIDFIVTDYQMPVCDGLEMLLRLDKISGYRRPPAILCTAKSFELDRNRVHSKLQLVRILEKPFSPGQLSELIIGHLQATHGKSKELGESLRQPLAQADSIGRRGDQVVALRRDDLARHNLTNR